MAQVKATTMHTYAYAHARAPRVIVSRDSGGKKTDVPGVYKLLKKVIVTIVDFNDLYIYIPV